MSKKGTPSNNNINRTVRSTLQEKNGRGNSITAPTATGQKLSSKSNVSSLHRSMTNRTSFKQGVNPTTYEADVSASTMPSTSKRSPKRHASEEYAEDDESASSTLFPNEKYSLPKGVKGLINGGNACYMNSVLQCLSTAKLVTSYFIEKKWEADGLELNNVSLQFSRVMTQIWNGSGDFADATRFAMTIGKYDPRFADGKQHDPHELLVVLLEALEKGMLRRPLVSSDSQRANTENGRRDGDAAVSRPTVRPSTAVALVDEDEDRYTEWAKFISLHDSIVSDVFYGQIRTTVSCTKVTCKHKFLRFELFVALSLPIPSTGLASDSKQSTQSEADRQRNEPSQILASKVVFITDQPKKLICFEIAADDSQPIEGVLQQIEQLVNGTKAASFDFSNSFTNGYPRSDFGIKFNTYYEDLVLVQFKDNYIKQIVNSRLLEKSGVVVPIVSEYADPGEPMFVYELKLHQSFSYSKCIIPVYVRRLADTQEFELVSEFPPFLMTLNIGSDNTIDRLYEAVHQSIRRIFVDAEFLSKSEERKRAFILTVCHPRRGKLTFRYDEFNYSTTYSWSNTRDWCELLNIIADDRHHPIPSIFIYADFLDWVDDLINYEALDIPIIRLKADKKRQSPDSDRLAARPKASQTESCTLADCLRLFCNISNAPTSESVRDDGFHEFHCEACKTYVTPTHQTHLSKLPEVFVIQLKRFNAKCEKVETFVKYPLQLKISDLDQFAIDREAVYGESEANVRRNNAASYDAEEVVYELIGVINHSGSLTCGHCIALCRNPLDKIWRSFSDTNHKCIHESEVINPNAYILFYQRTKDQSNAN